MSDLREASGIVRKILAVICIIIILAIIIVANKVFDKTWQVWALCVPAILVVIIGWLVGHMWFLMLESVGNIEANTAQIMRLLLPRSEPKQTPGAPKKAPAAPQKAPPQFVPLEQKPKETPEEEAGRKEIPMKRIEEFTKRCPNCGKSNHLGAQKCYSCGQELK